ncbi:MAG: hypothetical protein QM778_04560 [Myxococcales bacterium]
MSGSYSRSLSLQFSSSIRFLVASLTLVSSACGGGADGGVIKHQGKPDGGVELQPDGSISDDQPDASLGNCKTQCDADDCGEFVADYCGGHLVCNTQCPEGQVCGLKRADKCDPVMAHCEPMAASAVCAGKCGVVSDGCSGVIVCGSENGGVTCADGQRCDEKMDSATHNACVASSSLCQPQTCASQGIVCGVAGDGCGNILDCTAEVGGCTDGKICGTGANSGKCVEPTHCVAASPAVKCALSCGVVGDDCGGTIDCEASPDTACPSGTTCGGGGEANKCGKGAVCPKLDEATACAGKCGFAEDGCGGAYACTLANGGAVCDPNAGETCVQGVCTAPPCDPKTALELCPGDNAGHKSCGVQPDGCNSQVNCGGCAADETCGLAGPSLCGPNPTCQATPAKTACKGKCGTVADGCGGTYDCDSSNDGVVCQGNEFCGALSPNECGVPASTCTAKSCGDLQHSCGLASDGCGHVINCWSSCDPADKNCAGSCGDNAACLGDENNGGAQRCVAGAPTCTGSLCSALPNNCSASAPTRLTGTVRTPGRQVAGTWTNQLPVPNAIVYIPAEPNTALPGVFEGVDPDNELSCGRCADEKLVADGESVLAAAVSDYRGEFTLEGRIPVGKAFKLVVKVGKWRRVVEVPAGVAQACTSQPLGFDYTRLAAHSTDGSSGTHLPKVAISTGKVDEMECVFRNIGIADAEFTVPSGTGRLHMYRANGAKMANVVTTCTGNYQPPSIACTDTKDGTPNWGCANTQSGCKVSSKGVCSGTYKPPVIACSDSNGGTDNYGCANAKSGCKWKTTTTDISVADSNLYGSLETLEDYDLVVWDCEGGETFEAAPAPANVEAYVDAGGRMFASHFSYVWIEKNGTLDDSADWGMGGSVATGTGLISMPSGSTARVGANPIKSPLFRDWLDWQGALTGTTAGTLTTPLVPQFPITDPRDRAGAKVGPSTDEWVYRDVRFCSNSSGRQCTEDAGCQVCSNNAGKFCTADTDCDSPGTCGPTPTKVCANSGSKLCSVDKDCGTSATSKCVVPTCKATLNPRVQQLSFNTPYGAGESEICGRVAYSGFHVANASDNSGKYFPAICEDKELSAQEKILAFMLFDLATCVSAGDPPQPPSCTSRTVVDVCPNVNDACGYVSDGCGGVVDCAGCGAGFYCDGNACKLQECTPTSCAALGFTCGQHADGCGGIARNAQGVEGCGSCSEGQVCGVGGPGLCGSAACKQIAKATACPANSCGLVSDGCGGTYDCGNCTGGQVCGGGGAGLCGAGSCTATSKDVACASKNCGVVSDGCGGTYECGTCTLPDNCGGSGHPNVCGHPACTPYTQGQACAGLECGWVSNGCGGAIQCGTCANGGVCGGAGPNLCGASCEPTTCVAEGAQCGAVGDDCGGILQCGKCPSGQTCGAGGPNKCGSGPTCAPRSCTDAMAECGLVGDGCGGVLDCGPCTEAGETCGGAGVPNQCSMGTGGCNKVTCEMRGIECGAASDGCGGVLDCGGCGSGYTCEQSHCKEVFILQ